MPPIQLIPTALEDLPRADTAEALLDAEADCVWLPRGAKPDAPRDWLSPFDAPYLIMLRNAVFYPRTCLPAASSPPDQIKGLGRTPLGLVVSSDNRVFPDSLGKSYILNPCVQARDLQGPWSAPLPEVTETLPGTHLFAEFYYAHFGHCLLDTPARLWPLHNGLIDAQHIDSVLGQPMLGAGPRGQALPRFAHELLGAFGVPRVKRNCLSRPVRVDRLILPRRLAPFSALMHPYVRRMMRKAGRKLSMGEDLQGLPQKLWLSRAGLSEDARNGRGMARMDEIASEFGFTVMHPQTLPLARQAALVRAATHIGGPVGSQLHLCGFSETPGLGVFSVEPSYFRLPINRKLIADLGGVEDFYAIDLPRPAKGPRHQAPWHFDPDHEPGLRTALTRWLDTSPKG